MASTPPNERLIEPLIEPLYVADTHALIWYLLDSPQLSDAARAIFQAAEQGDTRIVISAIVLAELYYVNQKHSLFPDFASTYAELKARPYLRLMPFTPADVLDFSTNQSVPEMHDRIIAGLAKRLRAPLITVDAAVRAAHPNTVW